MLLATLVVFGSLLVGLGASAAAQTDDPAPDPVAQVAQDAEPGSSLVTSNTQIRRAVIGLVMVAVLTSIVGLAYWYFTGQDARTRFASDHPGVEPAPLFGFGRTTDLEPNRGTGFAPPTTRGRKHLEAAAQVEETPAPEPVGRHAAPSPDGLFDDPKPARRERVKPAGSLWDGSDDQARGPAAAAARGWPARTPRHTRPLAPTEEEELFDYANEAPAPRARFRPDNDDLFEP